MACRNGALAITQAQTISTDAHCEGILVWKLGCMVAGWVWTYKRSCLLGIVMEDERKTYYGGENNERPKRKKNGESDESKCSSALSIMVGVWKNWAYLVSSNPVRRRSVIGKRIRAMSVNIFVTAIVMRFALPLRQIASCRVSCLKYCWGLFLIYLQRGPHSMLFYFISRVTMCRNLYIQFQRSTFKNGG